MDPDVKSILNSHGYNVEHLREKYAKRVSGTGLPNALRSNTIASEYEKTSSPTTAKQHQDINCIYICESCQGIGVVKAKYNHIVREMNCEVCDGEGLLWRDKSNGGLVHLKERENNK